jgi:hypothetical protein
MPAGTRTQGLCGNCALLVLSLCISLPFLDSFLANIVRKRPELNRDKTRVYLMHPVPRGSSDGTP